MIRTINLVGVISFILGILLAGPASAVEQPLEVSPLAMTVQPASAPAPPAVVASSPVEPATPPNIVVLNPDSQPAVLVIRNRKIIALRADVAGLNPQQRVITLQQNFANAVSGDNLSEPTVRAFPPYGVVIQINHENGPVGGCINGLSVNCFHLESHVS